MRDDVELIRNLRAEIERLRSAIIEHRDQKGDSRCWLDDLKLYAVLDDGIHADTQLPPKCEFLESCRRYWEQRQAPTEKVEAVEMMEPGSMTIAQLEAKLEEVEDENALLRGLPIRYEPDRSNDRA